MYKVIGAYNLYNYVIIRGDVMNRDFESASKKILNYIEFSQKISKGKNKMLQGIYDITELTSSKTYTQKEFNQMERVYLEINEITDEKLRSFAQKQSDNILPSLSFDLWLIQKK